MDKEGRVFQTAETSESEGKAAVATKSVDTSVERVNVYELTRDLEHDSREVQPKTERRTPADVIIALYTPERIVLLAAFMISLIALVVSLARTELTIGQGQLYIEDASVNRMLGNLLQNDLGRLVPNSVGVREINVRVEIHSGAEDITRVSDISDVDTVTAEVVFFPQGSVAEFAADVRRVLDIMAEQSEVHGFVYDEIRFVARDTLTNISVTVSGRFTPNITVAEIAAITDYFGEIDVDISGILDFVS